MDAGLMRGIFTVVMLVLFLGVCFWAWGSKRKKCFDEAARMPLESDFPGEEDAQGNGQKQKSDLRST